MTPKKLEEKILALERALCNCCRVLPTTDGIPTEAPTNGQTVKVDFSAGIIYYFDSDTDTWESISSGGGGFFTSSINPPSTPVAQDANFSVYDINNLDQLNINGGVGGQIILTLEGLTGNSSVSIVDGQTIVRYIGDDSSYAALRTSNGTLLLETGDGVDDSSVSMDATGILLYSNLGAYSIEGLPTYADDTAAGIGGLAANRLYKTATGVLMIKL